MHIVCYRLRAQAQICSNVSFLQSPPPPLDPQRTPCRPPPSFRVLQTLEGFRSMAVGTRYLSVRFRYRNFRQTAHSLGNSKGIFFFRYNNFHYPSIGCLCVPHSWPAAQLFRTAVSLDQTSHSQIQSNSTTFSSSAGGRSRLPFEDVLRQLLRQHPRHDIRQVQVTCTRLENDRAATHVSMFSLFRFRTTF